MSKCVLRVTEQEAKDACEKDQVSGGFEAGIKGRIHAMRLLLAHHSQEENWGFLLIDMSNDFNEEK